ncbi:MAG: PAS domain-containing sensor histidine kinase [Gemmatimonadaceae bacterium]
MTSVGSPGELTRLAVGKLPHAALLTRGRDHIITFATELFGTFFGSGDQVGKPLSSGYPSIALAPCVDAMNRVIDEGARVTLDRVRVGGDEAETSYSFVVEPLNSPEGGVMGILLLAEPLLVETPSFKNGPLHSQVLEATLQAMHEGVCLFDAQGMIVFANRAADEMYTSERGKLVGRPFGDLTALPTWQSDRLLEAMDTSMRESGSWTGDLFNRRLDGELFVTSAQISAFESGGQQYRLCVEEDVTEHRRDAERTAFLANAASILAQSLEYRATLAAVAQLAVPTVADAVLIDVTNEEGRTERVGCTHRDPSSRDTLRAMVIPTGRSSSFLTSAPLFLRDVSEASFAMLFSDAAEAKGWRALGVRSWMSIPISLRGERFGTIALAITEAGRHFADSDLEVAIDLATRAANAIDNARLHTATTVARDEAESANRAKSELLSHASHDLRTPLNAISGYAELLEMGILGPVNDAQRDALSRVQRSQRHLLALINDLLHFTKLESGSVEFHFAEIDVSTIAKEVTSLIHEQAISKKITLRCGTAGAIRAWADEEKVFQIVLNLVRNSVKFTSDAGEVVVNVEDDSGNERVRVTVADNGIGIPSDKVDAIFEPFTQIGRSFSRPLEGSGLGLAISRELARAMGGMLQVSSVVGEGSTFTLSLPRRRPETRRGA